MLSPDQRVYVAGHRGMVGSAVWRALESRGFGIEEAKVEMVPTTQVRLEDRKAEQMIKLMEVFEDHDDVQNVWANFDIDQSLLEA